MEKARAGSRVCYAPFVVAESKPTPNETHDIERDPSGPDPMLGVGLVILGVLIMGIGGAATAHYLFNFGTAIAIAGAVLFVAFTTLSSYRQTKGS